MKKIISILLFAFLSNSLFSQDLNPEQQFKLDILKQVIDQTDLLKHLKENYDCINYDSDKYSPDVIHIFFRSEIISGDFEYKGKVLHFWTLEDMFFHNISDHIRIIEYIVKKDKISLVLKIRKYMGKSRVKYIRAKYIFIKQSNIWKIESSDINEEKL